MNPTASFAHRLAALPLRLRWLCAVAVVLVAGAVVAGFALTRDTRVPLAVSPLHPDQLAEVEQRLAAWDVSYVPGPDNVRVDRKRRSDLLLRLALAGVPRPHLPGTEEALAHVGALTPQAVVEAQTRDALGAELAVGLRGLDGVRDATVVVAPASDGIYADDPRRGATASVRITPVPGARLSARTIAGIRAFVAGGVAGLDPERVAVLDDRGLAVAPELDDAGVQSSLQSALDGAFGAGVTIVRVHREAIGERRDVHRERRSALDGAIARATTDERYVSDRKHYAKAQSTEDRGSATEDERRTIGPDATARLGIAILVDVSHASSVPEIRQIAEAAAAIDPRRGDRVSVQTVRFASAAPLAPRPATAWLLAAIGTVPQLLLAVALVVGAWRAAPAMKAAVATVWRDAATRSAAREAIGLPPARVRSALADEPPYVAAAVISALPTATAAAVLELYPPEERAQIVRRLARETSPLVPSSEELLRATG